MQRKPKMSNFTRLYLAHKLTEKKSIDDPEKLNNSIRSANIDLNPHQVDAAIFAFKSPLSRGAIFADEVGLGKTIEAGLIINQLWVEGLQHILILVPASLRTQWQDELLNHFSLESKILDGHALKELQYSKGKSNPLTENGIYIASHNFAYRYDVFVKEINWDLVVVDEAHRMRNVWKKGNKTAKIIREAIKEKPKLLLTATPLQNNLMELYGLTSFLDENYLGTEFSFRTLFVNPVKRQKKYDNLIQLKERLMGNIVDGEAIGGVLTRALRKQVKGLGFVNFTNRHSVTEDFAPNDDEMELYNSVSDYLRRPVLASTKATQRNMMELVYRKILASSSFAIAGTLEKIVHFLSKRLQQEHGTDLLKIETVIAEVKKEMETKHKKQLPEIKINKHEKVKDIIQETLPGLEDVELTIDKIEEEKQDSDDLGEDILDGASTKKKEREIDHKFTEAEIVKELQDVLSYFYLATTIDVNQKSQALIRILEKTFNYAEKRNWPQKAVIFTESRRTQDHLEKLLSGVGHDLVLFNGTNASKRAKDIFNEWASKYPAEAEKGSKSINIRKALVWKFKEMEKVLLITTEAGAEGLNLQEANIVINYDLPWNPQRIEQRIGRCHRYGQALDVLVINFLNKRNYADQRVYELLAEKIRLFGNLFDFSDKVLGTEKLTDDGYDVREIALAGLGSGMEFEKKVLSIYRNCRSDKQIKESFEQLQLELSDVIEEKIEDTQKKVIQHFDAEVRDKLKVRQKKMSDSLNKYDSMLKRYIREVFGESIYFIDDATFKINDKTFTFKRSPTKESVQGALPVNISLDFIKEALGEDKKLQGGYFVKLKHAEDKARKHFEDCIGHEGQLIFDVLTCRRKTVNNGDEIFDRIITSAIMKKGDKWQAIDRKRAEGLFGLQVIEENENSERVRDELLDMSDKNINEEKEKIGHDNECYVSQEMENLDRFVEEALLKNKQDMDTREKEIKELGRKLKTTSKTSGFYEKQQIMGERDKLQKDLFKAQKKYSQMMEEQFKQKDRKIADLRSKLQMSFEHKRIAQVHFVVES